MTFLPKHGHRTGAGSSPTYSSWVAMRNRCLRPRQEGYANYGGRGIEVDPRWVDFSAFLGDMGERPCGTTLERKNPEGPYSPSNCKWATRTEQARNTSRNIRFVFLGIEDALSGHIERLGLSTPYQTIRNRIRRLGWCSTRALLTPQVARGKSTHVSGI